MFIPVRFPFGIAESYVSAAAVSNKKLNDSSMGFHLKLNSDWRLPLRALLLDGFEWHFTIMGSHFPSADAKPVLSYPKVGERSGMIEKRLNNLQLKEILRRNRLLKMPGSSRSSVPTSRLMLRVFAQQI